MDERGPALRRHRPARLAAGRLGPERRRRGPGAVHPHRRRGARPTASPSSSRSPPSSSASAPAASPSWRRAVEEARERGALVADGRQARRHRLDHGRLRRHLPRPGLAAVLGRRHGQSRTWATARCAPPWTWPASTAAGLFVLALTSNPEGAGGPAGRARRRPHRRRHDARPPRGRERRRRAAGLLRRGRRRHARRSLRRSTWRSTARCSRPASAPRAPPPPTSRRSSATRCATSSRASAGGCCGTARTPPHCARRAARVRRRSARGGRTSAVDFGPELSWSAESDQDFSSVLADSGALGR